MNSQSYIDKFNQQSQEKFNRIKIKMLETVRKIQQTRQESLQSLITEIEKKQNILREKKLGLEKLCQN